MLFKRLFFAASFIVLPLTNASALVYLSHETMVEGIQRGTGEKESFATGVGSVLFNFIVEGEEYESTSTGVLLDDQHILTVAHSCRSKIKFFRSGEFVLPTQSGKIRLNIERTQFAPDADLAILKLSQKVNLTELGISITPVMAEAPPSSGMPFPGFLVSLGPISLNTTPQKRLLENVRHLAINRVNLNEDREFPIQFFSSEPPLTCWLQTLWNYSGPIEHSNGDCLNLTQNYKEFPDYSHRLQAITGKGDSGSPFFAKNGSNFFLLGIHKGKNYIYNDESILIRNVITPLYPHMDWIRSQLSN